MSLKCLNCHMVCAADDPACPFCGYKITNTAAALKKTTSAGTTKFALIFMVIGSAVYNSVIGPKMYPSTGRDINMERVLMAGLVGMGCALMGLVFGWLVTDRD